MANVHNIINGYISLEFHFVFYDFLRWLFAREMMTVQVRRSAVIFLVLIDICMPKRSLTLTERSFIGRHLFMMSVHMCGAIVINIYS